FKPYFFFISSNFARLSASFDECVGLVSVRFSVFISSFVELIVSLTSIIEVKAALISSGSHCPHVSLPLCMCTSKRVEPNRIISP
ncbi:unnamed protein product, partial [Schistosoma curassoni]|uniref:Secreted protein n=1 Tax=Schistosoma curassoni TaxID=6186 RepID=A0A183JP09_9TREM